GPGHPGPPRVFVGSNLLSEPRQHRLRGVTGVVVDVEVTVLDVELVPDELATVDGRRVAVQVDRRARNVDRPAGVEILVTTDLHVHGAARVLVDLEADVWLAGVGVDERTGQRSHEKRVG